MLALKGMRTVGQMALAIVAVPSVLLVSAVAVVFTLVCAAPLRLLQTR
jgi:hypothetical protein